MISEVKSGGESFETRWRPSFLDVYRALALALIERVTARICSGEQKQLRRGHRRCTRVHQTLRRVSGVSQFASGGRFGGPNGEDADEDSVGRIKPRPRVVSA